MWHARRWRNLVRRDALKRHCPQGLVGSSPTRRMMPLAVCGPCAEFEAVRQLVGSGLNDCEVCATDRGPAHDRFATGGEPISSAQGSRSLGPADDRHAHASTAPAVLRLLVRPLSRRRQHHQTPGAASPAPDHARPRLSADHRASQAALAEVMPTSRASVQFRRDGACVEVSSFSKHWPCLFPQHGPGRKHERRHRSDRLAARPLRPLAPAACFAASSTRTAAGRQPRQRRRQDRTPIRATSSPTTPPTSAGSSAPTWTPSTSPGDRWAGGTSRSPAATPSPSSMRSSARRPDHRLERVRDRRRRHQHPGRQPLRGRERADLETGAGADQHPRCGVPRVEPALVERVETAARRPRQVERG